MDGQYKPNLLTCTVDCTHEKLSAEGRIIIIVRMFSQIDLSLVVVVDTHHGGIAW